jgi:hypothetical protein
MFFKVCTKTIRKNIGLLSRRGLPNGALREYIDISLNGRLVNKYSEYWYKVNGRVMYHSTSIQYQHRPLPPPSGIHQNSLEENAKSKHFIGNGAKPENIRLFRCKNADLELEEK